MKNKNSNINKFTDSIKITLIMALWGVLIFCSPVYSQEKEPDYTSLAPHFVFPATLEEQESALKTNPLILRFAESRKKLSRDPYLPAFHFVSPENRMNDPNGLSFWQGNWHLFYQGYPPEDPRQHWGHAVSKDLIHWRDLPYAIYPNPERAAYSGGAFVDDGRVIAHYHGRFAGNMVAVSDDPLLLNWEKITGKPVIPMPMRDINGVEFMNHTGVEFGPIDPLPLKGENGEILHYRVFDPFLWKEDNVYYAISGSTLFHDPSGRRVAGFFLLQSPDLENWEYLHPLVEDDRFTMVGDDGACPYFWPIGDRHILLFFSHVTGPQYLLGDYDSEENKFYPTSHGYFNHGPANPSGVHAPSATPDGKGGVITIFNMNPGKPTEGWNQIMTLPMRLTLLDRDQLGIEPAGDIESLRYNHQRVDPMILPANEEIVFENIKGNTMEIKIEIDPKSAQHVELNVLRSPGKEEYTNISFYKERGYNDRDRLITDPSRYSLISIDSKYSSILPDVRTRAPETAPLHLKDGETLKLRVFIDKSVVEVFANGKQYAAVRVYPGMEDSIGISLRSQGQESELISLDAWQMRNIWDISLEEWHEKTVWR